MDAARQRLRNYSVDACPQCGGQHRYVIEVLEPQEAVLLFAGPGDEHKDPDNDRDDQGELITVGLICPVTQALYTQDLRFRAGERFVRVVDPSVLKAQAQANVMAEDNEEFVAWKNMSRDVAYRYCSTMQATSSAAIPVYFAVLAYVGHSKVSQTLFGVLSLLPPALLLGSLIVFSLAQRPTLVGATQSSFAKMRAERLKWLNRSMTIGNILFVMAAAIASVLFWIGLRVR